MVGQDGEIRITPFNMQEELEEGHFDTEGMYHWKKEKDVQDNWLENIDWCKVNNLLILLNLFSIPNQLQYHFVICIVYSD